MKKIIKSSFLLLAMILTGCGSSLPECSDKEVIALLKNISKKNDVELVKISGISTKNRGDKSCTCVALATFKDGADQEELSIQYEIDLSDDGKEFTVEMSLR